MPALRDGLEPVQGLDSRLLVHAENQCSFRSVQVEAHGITDLVDEERIRGPNQRQDSDSVH